MPELLAGTGRVDISPAPGTPHAGWGAQTHQRGLGVDLPLFATALVLSDGNETVAIADVDAINLSPAIEEQAVALASRATSIHPGRIRISHSHTHSGPNIFRLATITEGLELAQEYIARLPQKIAEAIVDASSGLRPVRLAGGAGSCGINVNRRFRTPDGRIVVGRNPDGPVDHTVRVLRFDDWNEAAVATIVHYACHPTINGWENQFHTPDYPGVVRRVVEEQVGGTCLFLQGAAGDVGPRLGFTGDLRVYRRLGRILGLEAAKVALELDPLQRQAKYAGSLESGAGIALYTDEPAGVPAPRLRVISRQVNLPVRPMGDAGQLAAEAAAFRERLNEFRKGGDEAAIRRATAMATQAGIRAERAALVAGKTHLPRRIMGIGLGSVALVSTQGEPFVEIGQTVAEHSPFPLTLFSGYSHGGVGYIPMPGNYAEGGYEVQTSPFAPEAATVLADEAIQLLSELKHHGGE